MNITRSTSSTDRGDYIHHKNHADHSNKEAEDAFVATPNAFANPGAMVIISFNADFA